MYGRMDQRKNNKTGKGFLVILSCLVVLYGTAALQMSAFGKVISDEEDGGSLGSEETDGMYRRAGGFDNPIDDRYIACIYECAQEEDITNRNRELVDYEDAWRIQVESYLEKYRFQCEYQGDKEMADEYLSAVREAVSTQKALMEYLEVEEAVRHWYSAQIYRCAFIKGIRGTFDKEKSAGLSVDKGQSDVSGSMIPIYKEYGEFENEIDREYALSMYEGCEAEIRTRQEELNAAPYDESFWGNGTGAGILEADGWINRLYYLQLEKMTEKRDGRVEKKAEERFV